MWWKCVFDVTGPMQFYYGRVWFTEADSAEAGETKARDAMAREYPDHTLRVVSVNESTSAAADSFFRARDLYLAHMTRLREERASKPCVVCGRS